jgi:tartrate-resistant acid phosphatase type 5
MAGLILNNKSMALCLVLVICSFGLCLVSTHAELQRFGQPAKTDGTLSFLVLGDWGRKGAFNQSEVAVQVLPASLLFLIYFKFPCVRESHATCN